MTDSNYDLKTTIPAFHRDLPLKSIIGAGLLTIVVDRLAPEFIKKFLPINTLKKIFSLKAAKQMISLEGGFKFKQVPMLDGIFYDSQSESQEMIINPIMKLGIPAAIIGGMFAINKLSYSYPEDLYFGQHNDEFVVKFFANVVVPVGAMLVLKDLLENH